MSSRLSLRARAAVAALALLPAGFVALTGGGADAKPTPVVKPQNEIFGDFYPANPATQLLKQPDGSTFAAKLTNGEIGGTFETDSGHTVVKGDDGVWRFATGERDKDGTLVASTIVAKSGVVPKGIPPHAGRTQSMWDDGYGGDVRAQTFRALQIASRKAQEQARANGEPRLFKFPALMLATWWDEEKGQSQPQFQDGSNTPEFFDKILDGFGGNPQGTMTEFYFEDSFGQFLVQVDVFGPFTSQRSREDRCYYGGIGGEEDDGDLDFLDENLGVGGGGAIGMALESVPQADPTVDFSQYDNDNDGEVDFTAIIHSGPDMAVTGNPCHTWSHATGVNIGGELVEQTLGLEPGTVKAGLQTGDVNTRMTPPTAVQVDRVFTMPEFSSETSPLTIGVATHEMSHALGEPDYYDTTSQSAGTGDWDIMAGGSYLGNPAGSNPSLHNPASRVYQGYVTPTVVQGPLKNVTLKPRNQRPYPGYTAAEANPNLLLVPVYEISEGETDARGHTWTKRDLEGVPENPATKKRIIEGYYIENINRMWHSPPEYENFSRGGYFDRKVHQSGLMVWHYDYYLRSNVRHNANNAQSFSNRPQMDPMEFDRNDNTQELQLNLSRGNVGDLVVGAAGGISSGTRATQPGLVVLTGDPQGEIPFTGVNAPTQSSDFDFTVDDNPYNYSMTVRANAGGTPPGDCTLQLLYEGQPVGDSVDGGFVGEEEVITVSKPKPGQWTARVGDFAGCISYSGKVTFSNGSDELPTKGAADTWSHWSGAPTGWAFTNVGPADVDAIAQSTDAVGSENITLDVMKYDTGDVDVSPGFAQGAPNSRGGLGAVNVGKANAMSVPVINHGGKAVSNVTVTVRSGAGNGPVVARQTVSLGGYDRKDVPFTFRPTQEGWYDLFVTVDDGKKIAEGNEDNNAQKTTGWAGPAGARVLVIDDDGELMSERITQGALAALGVPYATMTEHPTADELKQYEAVIWEAGVDRNQGQLDKGDRAALKAYLDGGGKLLIQSNRIASALGNGSGDNADAPDFLKNYLGATLGGADDTISRERVSEITGTGGVFGTVKGEIVPFAARPFIETLVPATEDVFGTVSPALSVDEVKEEGHYLGVSVAGDAAHKNFKTVTVGYNYAQHVNGDTTVSMVRSALDFFGVEMGTYTVRSAEPVVYHSTTRDQVSGRATPINAVVLGGKPSAPVSLHYRRHNLGGFYEQKMTAGNEPGVVNGEIPRFAATPDGIDYYLKAGTATTYEPRMVAQAKLTYAIGVQLPEIIDPLAVLPGGLKPVAGPPQPPKEPTQPTKPREPAKPTDPRMPATGLADVVPVFALLLAGCAVVVRRRSRRTGDSLTG